jgi:phosphatidylserine/phosphatidylglycerophosphate/cardiolipin synthase-like enzyme
VNCLIKAKKRGVSICVLLDRDRKTDPYNSATINKTAFELLESEGITTKYDSKDVLLHSKFVIIDKTKVVIGSHNWSAGSYFHYDDVSLVIESSDAASEMKTRFDNIWK